MFAAKKATMLSAVGFVPADDAALVSQGYEEITPGLFVRVRLKPISIQICGPNLNASEDPFEQLPPMFADRLRALAMVACAPSSVIREFVHGL